MSRKVKREDSPTVEFLKECFGDWNSFVNIFDDDQKLFEGLKDYIYSKGKIPEDIFGIFKYLLSEELFKELESLQFWRN